MAGSIEHHSQDMRMKLEFPVWYRSFTKSYSAWASAPSDLKAPLLLQGSALAKAESWLLAAPDKLSESQKRFIVRSITQRARGGGQSADPVPSTGKGRRWQWRRSSDRSLWHLYAVIAVGLWMFSPDFIRDSMEQALNPPDVFQELRNKEIAAAQRPNAGSPATTLSEAEPANAAQSGEGMVASDVAPPADTSSGRSEKMPADGVVAEPPAVAAPPAKEPPSQAVRLAALTRQQLDAGHGRAALLIGIEAVEAALAGEDVSAEVLDMATELLGAAMVTREQLAPIAVRTPSESAAQVCNDGTALAVTGERNLAVWRAGNGGRGSSQGLPAASLDGAGTDLECRRLLVPNLDFNVEVRSISDGRMISELHGHEATITAARFSPDGTQIITASKDGTGRIWSATSGRLRHLLSGHDWHLADAAFSPTGRHALTASSDTTARLWDTATGKEIHRLGHDGVVTRASFTADGRRIVTTSWDGFVRIWDAATGRMLHKLAQPGGLTVAAASRDGRLLATAADDGGVVVWDAESGQSVRKLDDAGAHGLFFTADNQRLVVLSWGKGLMIYDPLTGSAGTHLAKPEDKVVTVGPAAGSRSIVAITQAGARLTWHLTGDARQAIGAAKSIAPACLTADERTTLGLAGDSPAWCAQVRPRDAALPAPAGSGPQ